MALVLTLASLGLFVWGALPTAPGNRTVSIEAGREYQIAIRWPARMRLGDSGRMRLVMSTEAQSDAVGALDEPLPGAHGDGSRLGQWFEARLEVIGVDAAPAGELSQPLLPQGQGEFFWRLRPRRAGEFEAIIWISLVGSEGLASLGGNLASRERRLLSAQRLPIEVDSFLGLSGKAARLLGGVGMALGVSFGWMELAFWRRKGRFSHA